MKKETSLRESQDLLERLCEHQQAIVQAEQTLHEQCQEMGRWLRDLKEKYQGGHAHCQAEMEVLRMGNDCLQQLIAQRDQQLAELTQRLADVPQEPVPDDAHLVEVQALREQLAEKDAIIQQLQEAVPEATTSSLVADEDHDYEAELTEFRRQLEADRHELNEEIQQLRARNAELNDAAREAELQLSRERAQLARERVQLDRMREEIRQQVESVQRDAGVRERLAGIERLKDEVAERQRQSDSALGIGPSTANRKSSSSLTTWRNLLNIHAANR